MPMIDPPSYQMEDLIDSMCNSTNPDTRDQIRERLRMSRTEIISAQTSYDVHARRATLHQLDRNSFQGSNLFKDDLKWLYENKYASKGGACRNLYDSILTSTPYGDCPICEEKPVGTIDHILPKSQFHLLAIIPLNFIPACRDCNSDKGNSYSTVPTEEVIHPYYWNGPKYWLEATVLESAPASLTFHPKRSSTHDSDLLRRKHHLETHGLGALYSLNASRIVASLAIQLKETYSSGGPEAVSGFLHSHISSLKGSNDKPWKVATYEALSESEWYCSYGFNPNFVEETTDRIFQDSAT